MLKPRITLLLAAAAAFGACGGEGDQELVTHYRFCAYVYDGNGPNRYDHTVSFEHRALYTTEAGQFNLSVTFENARVESGKFCSPTVRLPEPLPAGFYMDPSPVIHSRLLKNDGSCAYSNAGNVSASFFSTGGGVVEEYARFVKPWSAYETKACREDDRSDDAAFQGWPDPVIPAAAKVKIPEKGPDPSAPLCAGNVCREANVLHASATRGETYIGHVTQLKSDADRTLVTFQQDMLHSASKNRAWLADDTPWIQVNLGDTRRLKWSTGCDVDAADCGPAEPRSRQTIEVPSHQTLAEVECIGSLCKGGSATWIGTEGTAEARTALVIALFGDYFTGRALALLSAIPGEEATAAFVPLTELRYIEGSNPPPPAPAPPVEPAPPAEPTPTPEPGDPNVATTANGSVFVRDTSIPELGEAWKAPNGAIWGEIAKFPDGSEVRLLPDQAAAYCEDLGARLPTPGDYAELAGYLGAYQYLPTNSIDGWVPHGSYQGEAIAEAAVDAKLWVSNVITGWSSPYNSVFIPSTGRFGAQRSTDPNPFRCVAGTASTLVWDLGSDTPLIIPTAPRAGTQ